MNLKQIIEESDKEFEKEFVVTWQPPKTGNFPDTRGMLKRFTHSNHVEAFMHERDRKILEGIREEVKNLDIEGYGQSHSFGKCKEHVISLINSALEN